MALKRSSVRFRLAPPSTLPNPTISGSDAQIAYLRGFPRTICSADGLLAVRAVISWPFWRGV